MDEFFTEVENQPSTQFQQNAARQPQQAFQFNESPAINLSDNSQPTFEFVNYSSQPQEGFETHDNQGDFNDFEEDQVTRKIRQQQQRIQGLLAEKSVPSQIIKNHEWEEKQKRQQEGRRQFEEYRAKKEEEKQERAGDNVRKQALAKEEYAKLNVAAGWKKVLSNINVRQGERKGPKDINRMREAIMHKREDDN